MEGNGDLVDAHSLAGKGIALNPRIEGLVTQALVGRVWAGEARVFHLA
jgi:hypothetical protein